MALQRIDLAHGVRRLGFGVSGAHGTPIVPARETDQLIRRAYELGIRLFDTGPSYGAGEAERRLGDALLQLPRGQCIIATKVGINATGLHGRVRDFSPDGIRRSVSGSLERLRMTYVDWLLLHGPAPEELTGELMAALEEEQFLGRVGRLGICGRGEELDVALGTEKFSLFMIPVNCMLDPAEIQRLDAIRASGAEIVGIDTLRAALPAFPSPSSRGAMWRLARAARDRLRFGTTQKPAPNMSAGECLRWALTEGRAHRIITTTTVIGHLEANVSAIQAIGETPAT